MNPVHNILGFKIRCNYAETHHGYYGLVCIGLAYYFSSWPLYGVGAVLFLDDLYQHYMQVDEPNYHSPIHQIYGKYLYKIPVVRKLNILLDDIFGDL